MNKEQLADESKKLLTKVKEVEHIPADQMLHSWLQVRKQAGKKRSLRKHVFLYAGSVAALLLFLLTLSVIFQKKEIREQFVLSADLLEHMEMDLTQEEVILVVSDEVIRLEDDSELRYDTGGKMYLKDDSEPGTSKERDVNQEEPEESINQIIVPQGKRMHVILSDGTKVHINSGSRMIYPTTFLKEKREIVIEGEVFLDVVKDTGRPFIVRTPGMDVKVLGTKFNLSSYRDTEHSRVVLVEGSVEVRTGNQAKETQILRPNQAMIVDGVHTSVKEVDVYEYICWIDNIMWLNKEPVGNVLDRLARSYGRTIVYDEKLHHIPISGKLDLKEELTESIEIICLSLSLNYETDASTGNIVLTLK